MTAFLKKLAKHTCALSNLQARFLMAGPTGEVKARCKNCRFIEPAPDQRDVVSIAALETFFHTHTQRPPTFSLWFAADQLLRGHFRVSFPFGWGVFNGGIWAARLRGHLSSSLFPLVPCSLSSITHALARFNCPNCLAAVSLHCSLHVSILGIWFVLFICSSLL